MKKTLLTGIAVLLLAAGTSLTLHYWPGKDHRTSSSWQMRYCLDRIRKEDDYALFQDNERRIMNWCADHLRWFDESLWYKPSNLTEAEKTRYGKCLLPWLEDITLSPKTIEDIFDKVLAFQKSKNQCDLAVGKARGEFEFNEKPEPKAD